jgi:hydroxyacylglutathione hydrolase
MNVIPFVHEGLGNSSYLVELPGSAGALIDPDRTVGRYLAAAEARGFTIRHIFETHLHADFVSGAREAAALTGARLFISKGANSQLRHTPLVHGQRLELDGVEVEAIASPGHTPEHLGYVFRMGSRPPALYSGGSLIVGGAGRTDLIGPDVTDALTRAQFRSIREAFAVLPDETLLYPTHGGGSFCSTGPGSARTSTLGLERRTNPLLAWSDEDEFVHWFPTSFPAVPDYFFRMRAINQAGPRLRQEVADPAPLAPGEFDRAARNGALIVDTRQQADFMAVHIPGALAIPFRDVYATWLGWLVPPDTPLLFVTGDEPLATVLDESLLVGYERFAGYLEGGMGAWEGAGLPVTQAALCDAVDGRRALAAGAVAVDVREPDEYLAGHIPNALHIPLGALQRRLGEVPAGVPLLTYCGHGERSATGLSILERAGFGPLSNLDLGTEGWTAAGFRLATGAA